MADIKMQLTGRAQQPSAHRYLVILNHTTGIIRCRTSSIPNVNRRRSISGLVVTKWQHILLAIYLGNRIWIKRPKRGHCAYRLDWISSNMQGTYRVHRYRCIDVIPITWVGICLHIPIADVFPVNCRHIIINEDLRTSSAKRICIDRIRKLVSLIIIRIGSSSSPLNAKLYLAMKQMTFIIKITVPGIPCSHTYPHSPAN